MSESQAVPTNHHQPSAVLKSAAVDGDFLQFDVSIRVPCSRLLGDQVTNAAADSDNNLPTSVGREPSNATGQHGRRRVPACGNCNAVAKKCDSGRPCERCVMKGLENTCVTHRRKRRNKLTSQEMVIPKFLLDSSVQGFSQSLRNPSFVDSYTQASVDTILAAGFNAGSIGGLQNLLGPHNPPTAWATPSPAMGQQFAAPFDANPTTDAYNSPSGIPTSSPARPRMHQSDGEVAAFQLPAGGSSSSVNVPWNFSHRYAASASSGCGYTNNAVDEYPPYSLPDGQFENMLRDGLGQQRY